MGKVCLKSLLGWGVIIKKKVEKHCFKDSTKPWPPGMWALSRGQIAMRRFSGGLAE